MTIPPFHQLPIGNVSSSREPTASTECTRLPISQPPNFLTGVDMTFWDACVWTTLIIVSAVFLEGVLTNILKVILALHGIKEKDEE